MTDHEMTYDEFVTALDKRDLELLNGTNEEGEEYCRIEDAAGKVVWRTWGNIERGYTPSAHALEDVIMEIDEDAADQPK